MNDPGLDEPVSQGAEDVEKDVYTADKKKAEAEEQDYLDPRYEVEYPCRRRSLLTREQSLVVCIHCVSTHSRYIRTYC